MRAVIPPEANRPHGGRHPPTRGLPQHLAAIKLPDGRRLGELSIGDIANVATMFGIPGANENGKQANCEALTTILDEIGRRAAEKAIDNFMRATLEGR